MDPPAILVIQALLDQVETLDRGAVDQVRREEGRARKVVVDLLVTILDPKAVDRGTQVVEAKVPKVKVDPPVAILNHKAVGLETPAMEVRAIKVVEDPRVAALDRKAVNRGTPVTEARVLQVEGKLQAAILVQNLKEGERMGSLALAVALPIQTATLRQPLSSLPLAAKLFPASSMVVQPPLSLVLPFLPEDLLRQLAELSYPSIPVRLASLSTETRSLSPYLKQRLQLKLNLLLLPQLAAIP